MTVIPSLDSIPGMLGPQADGGLSDVHFLNWHREAK